MDWIRLSGGAGGDGDGDGDGTYLAGNDAVMKCCDN